MNNPETGGNLFIEEAKRIKQWFIDNNKVPPDGAAMWGRTTVKSGNIPPGASYGALRKANINISELLYYITENPKYKKADYAPVKPIDIVLEVTTKGNNIGDNYNKTREWKLNISNKINFVYSIKEVEDIVRPLLKNKG